MVFNALNLYALSKMFVTSIYNVYFFFLLFEAVTTRYAHAFINSTSSCIDVDRYLVVVLCRSSFNAVTPESVLEEC